MTEDRVLLDRDIDVIDGEVCWRRDLKIEQEPGQEKLHRMLEQLIAIVASCYEKTYLPATPKPFSMREYMGMQKEQELNDFFDRPESDGWFDTK